MRAFLGFCAKAAISALLLYVALRLVSIDELVARMQRIQPGWIAAGLALLVAQLILASERWRRVAQRCGAEMSLRAAFRFSMIGAFFNQTLPSTIGGDVVRTWLLARTTSHWKAAVYAAFVDRAVGLIWLAALVFVCLPWSLAMIGNPVGQAAIALIGIAGIAGPIAAITIAHLAKDRLQHWSITRHVTDIAAALRQSVASRNPGAAVAALSVTIHMLTIVAAWCGGRAIGAPFDLGQALLLIPPVTLISAVPISIAGWGVREGAMVAAFVYAGLPEGDGLAVSILFGAQLFIIGCLGGLLWITSGAQIRKVAMSPAQSE
jgi:uncharacterized protein (TIRG00374 family)